MKERCLNPEHEFFSYYGGRGITVYQEWQDSFETFYQHIGPRPTKLHSLDRINNDLGYAPGNVRWATKVEQANNRRSGSAAMKLAWVKRRERMVRGG
jgi:hypothetical protein